MAEVNQKNAAFVPKRIQRDETVQLRHFAGKRARATRNCFSSHSTWARVALIRNLSL
jgi:hypothetical protein